MKKIAAFALLIIYVALIIWLWRFDIAWYWIIIWSYLAISLIQGLALLFQQSKNPEAKPWTALLGLLWPIHVGISITDFKSDHDRTIGDHKN